MSAAAKEFAAENADAMAKNITRLCGQVIAKGMQGILEHVAEMQLRIIELEKQVAAQPAAQQVRALTEAARDVLAERERQVKTEGWTPEHDDEHNDGTLAQAGACYAMWSFEGQQMPDWTPTQWPWADEWWKPTTPRRALIKAGALILAEVERLDRAAPAGIPGDSDGGAP